MRVSASRAGVACFTTRKKKKKKKAFCRDDALSRESAERFGSDAEQLVHEKNNLKNGLEGFLIHTHTLVEKRT